jgi:prepilin-type N-terminal cleavage/methylation domain-containing protein
MTNLRKASFCIPTRTRARERGMSLLELMFAMIVLSVGMLGAMTLMVVGISGNGRNKKDTQATILDQQILEEFATLQQYPKAQTVVINDCALTGANAHKANLLQAFAPGNGATLLTTGNAPTPDKVGDIDWSVAPPTLATATTAGYAMNYTTCGGDIYQVRWNVTEINNRLSLLTVSAQQIGAVNTGSPTAANAVANSRPTTLRTMIEVESSL